MKKAEKITVPAIWLARLSLSKSLLDKLADREASSLATATLSRCCWNPADSARKICKAAIFSGKNQ
ncbi:MAG: hypothetical protein PUD50_05900, partial [Eubacteriales bacterium]|nr:hypothetical protein [Eubacteriales bacterium]